jgi:hypothetical protein
MHGHWYWSLTGSPLWHTRHTTQVHGSFFRHLSQLNVIKPLILTLHEKLGIDRCAIWKERAEEFDSMNEVNMHNPVLEDAGNLMSRMKHKKKWALT